MSLTVATLSVPAYEGRPRDIGLLEAFQEPLLLQIHLTMLQASLLVHIEGPGTPPVVVYQTVVPRPL